MTVSEASLTSAVAFAAEAGSAQLTIARDGDVLVDETYDAEPVDVYAVQKALVSVMFGIAEARQLLHLDDPVSDYLGPGWTQLPRTAEPTLSIRRVLNMTTGLDDELRPLGDVGVSWRYNNVAYNYLKTALELVTDMSMNEVTRAWLLEPLGMSSTSWVDREVFRPDGRPITGLLSTASDLALFGSMVLAGGHGVAPRDFLGSLGQPGSDENPAWGLCWWNNNQPLHRLPRMESDVQHGAVTPEAPDDMIAARGALQNRLYLVPSLSLVVARTAALADHGDRPVPFDGPFWTSLA